MPNRSTIAFLEIGTLSSCFHGVDYKAELGLDKNYVAEHVQGYWNKS
jgi:hypothetical protein